jgi:hypothetical protein
MTVSMPDHQSTTGRFSDGNSAYLAKQQRIADRLAKLRDEYCDSAVLPVVAVALDEAERARSREACNDARNTASRLIKGLVRKPKRVPTLAEVLDDDDA